MCNFARDVPAGVHVHVHDYRREGVREGGREGGNIAVNSNRFAMLVWPPPPLVRAC